MKSNLTRYIKAEFLPRRIYFITMAICFLGMPVMYMFSERTDLLDVLNFAPGMFANAVYAAGVFVSVLLVTSLFSDCHRPEEADISLSLPISSKERFLSRLYVYLISSVVPFIIGYAAMGACAFALKLYHGYTIAVLYPWACTGLFELTALLSCGAIAFICSAFSKSKAAALSTSFIAAAALSTLPVCIDTVLQRGADIAESFAPIPLICSLGISGVVYIDEERIDVLSPVTAQFVITMLFGILLSAAMVFAAYRTYKKRSRKNIFSASLTLPFAFILTALCAMCIISYMVMLCSGIGVVVFTVSAMLLFAGVVFFVKKSLNGAVKWLCSMAALCIVFAALCAGSFFTEGYHLPEKIPPYIENGTNSVTININNVVATRTNGDIIKYKNLSESKLKELNSMLEEFSCEPESVWDRIRISSALNETGFSSLKYNIVFVMIDSQKYTPNAHSSTYYYILSPDDENTLTEKLKAFE